MKKRLLSLAIVTASSTALATNGDNMIGVGAVTRAMGGTGTALAVGTESALKNPALMQVEGDLEVDFAANAFMPKVTAENTTAGAEKQTSASDMYPIPAIGLMYKINEDMVFGVGAWGVAGLGVDYRDSKATDGLYQLSTSLSLFKFAPSLKYQVNDNFSVGVGLHMLQGNTFYGVYAS